MTNTPDCKQEALGAQIMEEVRRYNDGNGCTRRQLVDNILIAINQSSRASVAAVEGDAPHKWDKSGLKEACQRALKLGRTRQETDIQLFLDMLLEIERLEGEVAASK